MKHVDLTPLLQAVISLAAIVITTFLIPLIRKRTSHEEQSELRGWVSAGVAAAEQLYQSDQGKEKKVYVQHFLKGKGYTLDIASLEVLIESEVKKMRDNEPLSFSEGEVFWDGEDKSNDTAAEE